MKYLLTVLLAINLISCSSKDSTSSKESGSTNTSYKEVDLANILVDANDEEVVEEVDFGQVEKVAIHEIIISNSGSTVKNLNITLDEESSGYSIKTNRCSNQLQPKQKCIVTVQFASRNKFNGQHLGGISLAANAQLTFRAEVINKPNPEISGTPELELTLNAPFSPKTAVSYRNLTIKNIGSGTAKNLALVLPQEYSVRINRCPESLKPAQSCVIQVSQRYFRNSLPVNADFSIQVTDIAPKLFNPISGLVSSGGGGGPVDPPSSDINLTIKMPASAPVGSSLEVSFGFEDSIYLFPGQEQVVTISPTSFIELVSYAPSISAFVIKNASGDVLFTKQKGTPNDANQLYLALNQSLLQDLNQPVSLEAVIESKQVRIQAPDEYGAVSYQLSPFNSSSPTTQLFPGDSDAIVTLQEGQSIRIYAQYALNLRYNITGPVGSYSLEVDDPSNDDGITLPYDYTEFGVTTVKPQTISSKIVQFNYFESYSSTPVTVNSGDYTENWTHGQSRMFATGSIITITHPFDQNFGNHTWYINGVMMEEYANPFVFTLIEDSVVEVDLIGF